MRETPSPGESSAFPTWGYGPCGRHGDFFEWHDETGAARCKLCDDTAMLWCVAWTEVALGIALVALRPFATFAAKWDAQPLKGIADEFYAIHTGTPYEAALTLTDCRAARTLVTALDSRRSRDGK